MTSSQQQELVYLKRRLQELEAAVLRETAGQTATPTRRRFAAATSIAAVLSVVAGSILFAQTPATSPSNVEQRLKALEGMLRRGPGNAVQITGPFEVVASSGKSILRVDTAADFRAAVSIALVPNAAGGYLTVNDGGIAQAVVSATSGRGEFAALDAKQVSRASMQGTGGIVVYDANGKQLAGITQGESGGGRLAIWRGENKVVDITTDPANGGAGILSANDANGQSVARLSLVDGAGEVLVTNGGGARLARLGTTGGAGALSVMNAAGKPVAGLMSTSGGGVVAVAPATGGSVAEMSVASDGRGLFQVFARGGGKPLAVMTQAVNSVGGLVQLSNASTPVANLTVGSQGAGYLQLANPSGAPTVEAGTLPNGNGQVRAGPYYKCLPVQAATPVLAVGLPDCIVGGQK